MEHITFHSELNNDFQPDNGIYSEIINHEISTDPCSSVFIDGLAYNYNSISTWHSAFCTLHSKLESAVEGIKDGVSRVANMVKAKFAKAKAEKISKYVSKTGGKYWHL